MLGEGKRETGKTTVGEQTSLTCWPYLNRRNSLSFGPKDKGISKDYYHLCAAQARDKAEYIAAS